MQTTEVSWHLIRIHTDLLSHTTHLLYLRTMVYSKRKGDANKLWCNEIVSCCADKFLNVRTRSKNALVLDDHNFQSTLSIRDKKIGVYIAQHDRTTFKKMNAKQLPSNVSVLVHDDCGIFNNMKNVVIDHADFCGTSKSIFPILRERFLNGVYDTKAILRITVCQRGSGLKKAKFCADLMKRTYELVEETPYAIKPLTVKQWCEIEGKGNEKDFGDQSCLDSEIYHYGTQMYTVICLVTRLL